MPSTLQEHAQFYQEEVSLKKSTSEKKSAILDGYTVYLHKHWADLEIKDNGLLNLRQSIHSFSYRK